MLRVQSRRDPESEDTPPAEEYDEYEPESNPDQEPAPDPAPPPQQMPPTLRPVSRSMPPAQYPQQPQYGAQYGQAPPQYGQAPSGQGYGYPVPAYPQYLQAPPPQTGDAMRDYMQYQMWKEMRADVQRQRQEAKPSIVPAKPAQPVAPDAKTMVTGMKTQLQAIQEAATELQGFMAPNPAIEFLNTPFAGGIGNLFGQVGVIIAQSFVEDRKMRRLESMVTRYEKAVQKGAQIPAEVHAQVQAAIGPGMEIPQSQQQMPNGGMPMQQQGQFDPMQQMMQQQMMQQGMPPQGVQVQIPGQQPVQAQIIPPQRTQSGQVQSTPFGMPLDQMQARQRQQQQAAMNPAGGGGLQLEANDRQLIEGFTQRAQQVETLFAQVNAKLDTLIGSKPGAGAQKGEKPSCPFCQAKLEGSPEVCPECGENLKGAPGDDDGWGP